MEKRIIWTRIAIDNLDHIYEYIFNTSKSKFIAGKVIDQIYNSASMLCGNYEIYRLDAYKSLNDGSYRAYEIFHYRISYKVSTDEIFILSVKHTSMNPKLY